MTSSIRFNIHLAMVYLFMAVAYRSVAQEDFTWWNNKHQWNGVSSWSTYLKYGAGYMGPNALPVPATERGMIDTLYRFECSPRVHTSAGDGTQDLLLRYRQPFAGGRVAMGLEWMAYEHYRMDTVTRDERAARDRDGEGYSTGDVNLSTWVQLIDPETRKWGLLLRVNLRTASGNNLKGARHTDAPGYAFDLSTGRWFGMGDGLVKRIRPYAMAGFLAYQTNRTDYFQNDCFLYGAGITLDQGTWDLDMAAAGYIGYLDLRDEPLVLRVSAGTARRGTIDHRLGLQKGLRDWSYTTVTYTLGLSWPERCEH